MFVDAKNTIVIFCYFILSFCLWVIRKSLRKNLEIFVNLRRSSGQSVRERSDRWPLFLVFNGVTSRIDGIRGIMGCSGVFRGCSGVFRGFPGCSEDVPGCSRVSRGCSGFYRHPSVGPKEEFACSNTCKRIAFSRVAKMQILSPLNAIIRYNTD